MQEGIKKVKYDPVWDYPPIKCI